MCASVRLRCDLEWPLRAPAPIPCLEASLTTELLAVAANAALLLVLLLVQQVHHDVTKGVLWALRNREDETRTALGGRIERTVRNHIESMVMFTATALALVAAGLGTDTTALAAMAFVGFRALYAVLYIAGAPYVRSVVWTAGIASLCAVGWPLLTPLVAGG